MEEAIFRGRVRRKRVELRLLEWINVIAAGVLAGMELCVRFGVNGPLASLADGPRIQLRQALILRLRILVPIVFGVALLSGTAALFAGPSGLPFHLRLGGAGFLLGFITLALAGTVPINAAVLTWDPALPPTDWRRVIARWERIDVVRALVAVIAFGLFTVAAMLA